MKFINDILAFLSGVGEKSSFENLFKETKIPNILLYLVIVLVGFVTTVLLVIYLVLNFDSNSGSTSNRSPTNP